MGLVVQATPDPVLDLLAPQAAPTADAQGVPDAFQALLSELLGATGMDEMAPGAAKGVAVPQLPLPAADADTDGTKPSAALLAALAQLQPLVPQAQTPDSSKQSAAAATPAQDPSTTSIGAVALNLQGADPGNSEVAGTESLQASPEPSTPTNDEATPPSSVAPSPADPTTGTTNSPSSTPVELPSAEFARALEKQGARLEHRERAKPRSEDATEAPPGDPPPLSGTPASTSVVRAVGNADEEADDNQPQGNEPGRPQPKASVEGVAHASDQSVLHRSDELREAASADAPAPPTRAELPEAAQQVVRAVVERAEQGGGEAKLHLRPENLGEVTLRVHADGDHVRVEIHAERPEAAQLFREHAVDLSSMLGQQGLQLADVWVGLTNQQSGGNQGQPEQAPSNRPGTSDFAALMGVGDPAATATHNRLRAAYNPDGAHIYRV